MQQNILQRTEGHTSISSSNECVNNHFEEMRTSFSLFAIALVFRLKSLLKQIRTKFSKVHVKYSRFVFDTGVTGLKSTTNFPMTL